MAGARLLETQLPPRPRLHGTRSQARPSVSVCGQAPVARGLPTRRASRVALQPPPLPAVAPPGSALHREAHITLSLRALASRSAPGCLCAPGQRLPAVSAVLLNCPVTQAGAHGPGVAQAGGLSRITAPCVCLAVTARAGHVVHLHRGTSPVCGEGPGWGTGADVPTGMSCVGASTHRRQSGEGACVGVLSGVRLGGGVPPGLPRGRP